jgi:hypothetical protein
MFTYTKYFEEDVLEKRPYLKKEWCEQVVSLKKHMEVQEDGRHRFWGRIPEYGNRFLRVITLSDQKTILNAFFDRNFEEVN